MIDYSPVLNQIVFKSPNPMTGQEVQVIFNEQNQPRKKLLMWNHLLKVYMFSCNAGLSWKNLGRLDVLYPELFIHTIETSDLVLSWKGQNDTKELVLSR